MLFKSKAFDVLTTDPVRPNDVNAIISHDTLDSVRFVWPRMKPRRERRVSETKALE